MVLIIGGACQGKLTWAMAQYDLQPDDLCDLAVEYRSGKRCYFHLEAATRRGAVPEFPADAVVIAREIGSGVVPMSAEDRAWRERHGVALRQLAARAEHVYRVFCGIGEVLK